METSPALATDRALLVREGEIFLKGGNRSFFEQRLVENVRARLSGLNARVDRAFHRMLIWAPAEQLAAAQRAVGEVFGVTSSSLARVTARDLDAIGKVAVEVTQQALAGFSQPPTFKVESRRADKRFPHQSPEISRTVGGAIVQALGLKVDVHHPQIQVEVEIGYENAFVFCESVRGLGGLPVGVSGKAMLLLSGGIDSPVAGWCTQKRGCHVDAVYFHSFPYTSDRSKEKVITLAQTVARFQPRPLNLHVVHFTDVQKQLRQATDGKLAVVLYRRMMFRVAEALAKKAQAGALVTGEALGQVASQTLDNLGVIGQVASLPVLRPLIAHDKEETVLIARRIGTFETSILPYDDCCALFVPDHPETHAQLARVEAEEKKVDIPALVEACLAGVEVLPISPVI